MCVCVCVCVIPTFIYLCLSMCTSFPMQKVDWTEGDGLDKFFDFDVVGWLLNVPEETC